MMELDVMVEDEDPTPDDDTPPADELVTVEELCAAAEEDKVTALLDPGSAEEPPTEEPPTELPAADELCAAPLVEACPADDETGAALEPVDVVPLLPAPEETVAVDDDPTTPLEEDEDDEDGSDDDEPTTPLEELVPAPTATQVPSVVHTNPPRQSAESRHSFLLPVHAIKLMPTKPPSHQRMPRMTQPALSRRPGNMFACLCFACRVDLGWDHTTP